MKKKKPTKPVTINSMVFGEDEHDESVHLGDGVYVANVTADMLSDVVSMVDWPPAPVRDEAKELKKMADDYAKWASLHRTIIWCVGMVVGAVTLIQVLGMFVPRCGG